MLWVTIIWLSAGETKYATYKRPFAQPVSMTQCRAEAKALEAELSRAATGEAPPYVRVACAPERRPGSA
jgi:hypothetical protein